MRPSPAQWARYTLTGSVPAELHEWVLHDTTCRSWFLRHLVRFLIYLAPLMALVLVLPFGPIGLRLGLVFVGIAGSVVFSFGYIVEGLERRVVKAGYPWGTAARIREERSQNAQRDGAAKRRAKAAARRARR